MPTWSHGCSQAHNHTLYPTSAVGIPPMEDLAEVQVGARRHPSQTEMDQYCTLTTLTQYTGKRKDDNKQGG